MLGTLLTPDYFVLNSALIEIPFSPKKNRRKRKYFPISVFGYREEKKEREKNIYFFYLVCKWKGKEKYMFLPLCPYICLFDVFIDIFV